MPSSAACGGASAALTAQGRCRAVVTCHCLSPPGRGCEGGCGGPRQFAACTRATAGPAVCCGSSRHRRVGAPAGRHGHSVWAAVRLVSV